MKLLVTGGCGFIGSNFILNQVLSNHNTILNIDKLTYAGSSENLSSISNNPNYSLVVGDICNNKLIVDSINEFQPDAILHFAAESHVDRSISSPLDFVNTNIVGTANILNASLKFWRSSNNPFRFIHISTDEVFGSLGKDGLFSENSSYRPNSPYSASKASSDHLVRSWHYTYNFPSIITNCSNNYGPYQYPEKLIPLTITNCLDEKPIPIYGNGSNIRDWLFVKDHCEALNNILLNGLIGNSYNIGGNNEISNLDIVKSICTLLDKIRPRKSSKSYLELISFVQDRPGHDFRYAIDSSKIKNELKWVPKINFEDGIIKTIKWYLNNEKWWRDKQIKGLENK